MKLLENLYNIHAYSGNEHAMQEFVINYCAATPGGVTIDTDEIGNIFVTKGSAASYPGFCAHLDEVHDFRPHDFRLMRSGNIIFAFSESEKRTCGIGADDKNGIYICLRLLEELEVVKIAFFVEEESGTIGSGSSNIDFWQDCNFIIQPDRRGGHDFITRGGFTSLSTRKFFPTCQAAKFGYQRQEGSLTDVVTLKRLGVDICVANISCGYYNPHTDSEATDFAELTNALDFCRHVALTVTTPQSHRHTTSRSRPRSRDYYNIFGRYYNIFDDPHNTNNDEDFIY